MISQLNISLERTDVKRFHVSHQWLLCVGCLSFVNCFSEEKERLFLSIVHDERVIAYEGVDKEV